MTMIYELKKTDENALITEGAFHIGGNDHDL